MKEGESFSMCDVVDASVRDESIPRYLILNILVQISNLNTSSFFTFPSYMCGMVM